LEEFVSGSGEAGFIYLSFGSILRGVDLPESTRRAFIQAFARLPQRVLWKYEGEIDDLPSNIRLSPWLPQQDLLGHPKIKLFITHGGLFSIQEAVYHGVPFIGLPVFADQFNNIHKAEEDGYAIHLNWNSLTSDGLYRAIKTILQQPRYQQRIGHASALMRDQTEHPLDRAIFWIEYVIRHKGAPHLRTHVRHMSLWQRGLLDVAFILLCLAALIAYATYRIWRYAYSRLYLAPCSSDAGVKRKGKKSQTSKK
jgi:glucuronosyltransferase